jgi:glycosyltransferase involved in cell wall biosynthesis
MRIALVGTRGVPARYGGFETCVEEVGRRLVKAGHEVVVYCRASGDGEALTEYEGMSLVHLPALRRKSLETLSHTAMSALHMMRHPVDVAIVFNAANSPFLPLLRARGIPVATHVDGLEWKRAKWRGAGRRYYRLAESMAVRWSDALIADAEGIASYYAAEFGADTDLLTYGAPILSAAGTDKLSEFGLRENGYHLVVARFEPENHVDVIVDGYRRSAAELPLVVVGAAPYADEYTRRIHSLADDRVRFLGSVWDQRLLDQLYANALTYEHGHSVGGTNPSLLRAMGAGTATIAFDVSFNREVLGEAGAYFADSGSLANLLEKAEGDRAETAGRACASRRRASAYDWDEVAVGYADLCARLVQHRPTQRPSGRRKHSTH